MDNNCSEIKKTNKPKKSNNNVITFKANDSNFLTEKEINNLFLGFVNLIKQNTVYEKEKQYKIQINNFNKRITEFLQELEKKNQEILRLKQQISELNNNEIVRGRNL